MNVIKPTPSSAAVAMQKYFASQGTHLSLSVVQEGLARAEGYNSWNALVSDRPARGNRPTVSQAVLEASQYSASEGLQLWAISGRVCGADDDSMYVLWAPTRGDASEAFQRQVWEDSDGTEESYAARNPDKNDEDQIYVVNEELVGSIQNGRFVFEGAYAPSAR